MVVILYKKTDHNQFLFEIPGNTLVQEIVLDLVECKHPINS